jgi:hypothetical protein
MRGRCLLGLSNANRHAAGVVTGDEVEVEVNRGVAGGNALDAKWSMAACRPDPSLVVAADPQHTALGHGHGATWTADHHGEVEPEPVAWFEGPARASTRSPGFSRPTSSSIRRRKYSVCIAAQCSTDVGVLMSCAHAHTADGAPSCPPDAVPADAHQKP